MKRKQMLEEFDALVEQLTISQLEVLSDTLSWYYRKRCDEADAAELKQRRERTTALFFARGGTITEPVER